MTFGKLSMRLAIFKGFSIEGISFLRAGLSVKRGPRKQVRRKIPGLRKMPATPLIATMASLARPVNLQLVNIPVPNRTLMSMAMIPRDLMP
jgi:hypothetical protein